MQTRRAFLTTGALVTLSHMLRAALPVSAQSPTPPRSYLPHVSQSCNSFALNSLCACRNWITFAPPRPFNPDHNTFPSEAQLRASLAQLRNEGWQGVVTYSLDGALAWVPRLAKEVGFTSVIAGLFWYDNAQLLRERKAAVEQLAWIDAFALGNEGIQFGRYTRSELASEIAHLKSETDRPVATTETMNSYRSDRSLLEIGDWIFPNIHPWFANIRTVSEAAKFVQDEYRWIQTQAPARFVSVKEAWWPTRGEATATEANQVEFFRLLSAMPVKFVWGEAYDQYWKSEGAQGPNWGLHTDQGIAKQVISVLHEIYSRC